MSTQQIGATYVDGVLYVPTRAEGPDGIVGDALLPLTPDHPLYAEWREWERQRARQPIEPTEPPDAAS